MGIYFEPLALRTSKFGSFAVRAEQLCRRYFGCTIAARNSVREQIHRMKENLKRRTQTWSKRNVITYYVTVSRTAVFAHFRICCAIGLRLPRRRRSLAEAASVGKDSTTLRGPSEVKTEDFP